MTKVWSWSQAAGTALLVLLALADIADDNGECWPAMRTLAIKCRIDTRTARRQIRALEDLGEVVVVVGGGKASTPGGTRSNRYRIVVHVPAEEDDESGDLPYFGGAGDLPDPVTGDRDGGAPVSGVVGRLCPHNRQLPVSDPSLAPAVADAGVRDAVIAGCQLDPAKLSARASGQLSNVVAELVEVGATPHEVTRRAAAYRDRWPAATLTPHALAKHWAQLGPVPSATDRPAAVVDLDACRRWGARQVSLNTEAEVRDAADGNGWHGAKVDAAVEGWRSSRAA